MGQTQEYYTNYITREEAVMGETQEVMGNYIEAERTGIEKIRPAAQREIIQETQREVVTQSSGEVIYLNDTLHPGGATLIDGVFDRTQDTRGNIGSRREIVQPSVMQYGAPVATREIIQPAAYQTGVMQYGAPQPVGYQTGVMQYGAPAQVGAYGSIQQVQYGAPVVSQAGLFGAIDTNHDGSISRAEFARAMGR